MGAITRRSFVQAAAAFALLGGTMLAGCSSGSGGSRGAAAKALGDTPGAIVALDPATGQILELAENNNAAHELRVPGSIFKTVTLMAALEAGAVAPADTFTAPASLKLMGGTVDNAGLQAYQPQTLTNAFAQSVNTVYAQVALKLGAQPLAQFAESIGFETPLAGSAVPASTFHGDNLVQYQLAWAGDGQTLFYDNDLENFVGPKVNAVHMAALFGAIANGGVLHFPYGEPLGVAQPASAPFNVQIASSETIAFVQDALAKVVAEGTGTAAAVPGWDVRGKTGTGESGRGYNDCWFCGYASKDKESALAFAVLVEGESSTEACEVAARFLSEM